MKRVCVGIYPDKKEANEVMKSVPKAWIPIISERKVDSWHSDFEIWINEHSD